MTDILPDTDDRRVDRSGWSVVSLDSSDSDLQYWLSRAPRERLVALEQVSRHSGST